MDHEAPSLSNPNTGYVPLVINLILFACASCVGILRVYMRIFVIKSFGIDDIFIILAIVSNRLKPLIPLTEQIGFYPCLWSWSVSCEHKILYW
jgi:hypothetical protein